MQNEWIFSSPLPMDHFMKHFHLLSTATQQHGNSLEGAVMICTLAESRTGVLTFLKGTWQSRSPETLASTAVNNCPLAPTESMNQATSVNSFMSFVFFVEKLRMGLLTCILRRTQWCSVIQQLVLEGPGFKSQPCHLPAVWSGASY